MNKKILRAASLILTCVVLSATAVLAKGWVNVSGWAYNDVSNFTNEGLLPESFDSVTDYRTVISEGQFAELLNRLKEKTAPGINGIGGYDYETELTREKAAHLLYYTGRDINAQMFNIGTLVSAPFADTADFAYDSTNIPRYLVSQGIMSVDAENKFRPKETMTIEQAVTMVYRLYNKFPFVRATDGANVSADSEVVLQAYNNGYYETKEGNYLYITDGSNRLMTFETDVYSRIDVYANANGTFAAARKFNHTTELYNIDGTELVLTVPHDVLICSDKYIFTASEDGTRFGVYDYSGAELLASEYSLNDLKGKGYYDISVSDQEGRGKGNYITDITFRNSSDIGRTTWVGNCGWGGMSLYLDGSCIYTYEGEVGIDLNGENSVVTYTYMNGQVYFEMTWAGLDMKHKKRLIEMLDRDDVDWEAYNSILKNKDNYTDIYNLRLVRLNREYGNGYGAEGEFTLLKNGEAVFENVKGYLYNMPSAKRAGWYTEPELSLKFEHGGREYELSAQLRFEEKTSKEYRELQRGTRILEKSIDTKHISFGEVAQASFNGKEADISKINSRVKENSEYRSGSAAINTKYGVSRVSIALSDDSNASLYAEVDAAEVTAGSVTGDFYIYSDNMRAATDVVRGTISGLDGAEGDYAEFCSSDGRYYARFKIEAPEEEKSNLSGTREVAEFTGEEDYFVGTPAQQDEYDLENPDKLVRRIVIDDDGKVMFVVPIRYQQYPDVCLKSGEPHYQARTWNNMVEDERTAVNIILYDENGTPVSESAQEKKKILLWDSWNAEAIAVIPPEYQFCK